MTVTPLDRLRAIADGTTALAPVTGSFGTVLDEVEPGSVTARMPIAPPAALRGPDAVLVLADLALSAAAASVLPAGRRVSTLTLHASGYGVRPRPGAALVAVGRLVHVTEDSAVCSAEVRDGEGTPLASLSCRCAVLPAADDRGEEHPQLTHPEPLAALGAATSVDDGAVAVDAVAAPLLANSGGGVQGGVLAALAGHALDEAVGAARPHLAGAAAELDVTFLRAVPADGSAITARAGTVHTGSRFTSARAEIHGATGRLALVATAAHWRGGPAG